MPDRNFLSFSGHVGCVRDLVVDPDTTIQWSDALKFSNVHDSTFERVRVLRAGAEDGVDMNNFTCRNVFKGFTVPCGRQALTLKGGSCDNVLVDWLIVGRGKFVELGFGNWSDQSHGLSTGNVIRNVRCDDGKPVRYARRFGCLPQFCDSDVRHVWWMSVGITFYYWGKYIVKTVKP